MNPRLNEIIENILNTGWTAVLITKTALTGLTCTVTASTKTVVRASGSWITDGIAVGDIITFSSFAETENNVAYTVATVSATTLTGTTAAAMKDETNKAGVGADPLTKAVHIGRGMIDQLRVNTGAITVTPYNGTSAMWGTVASTADLNFYCSPAQYDTSLKLVFSADGNAWVLYKPEV